MAPFLLGRSYVHGSSDHPPPPRSHTTSMQLPGSPVPKAMWHKTASPHVSAGAAGAIVEAGGAVGDADRGPWHLEG